ncbi:MAG: Unknown protein [uncultured Sulfurovum sp.]|uniref:Lcl C-terminal domain-containing protein n=1 Tax=uncultured Sulfurovum sp. TaxID=269237 RepID=A0A6S6TF66_9BACT|nr:MAG: Unknown protein [uncultured Sulfurovum sp.]
MKQILLIIAGLSSLLMADFSRDNGTQIVTDSSTNLQWQDDVVGSTMNWESAISHCEALTLNGHDDWRLPNFNELYSIADRSTYNPAMDPAFSAVSTSYYWSSTTDASHTSVAWVVDFYLGYDDNVYKTGSCYVRCVRDGQ